MQAPTVVLGSGDLAPSDIVAVLGFSSAGCAWHAAVASSQIALPFAQLCCFQCPVSFVTAPVNIDAGAAVGQRGVLFPEHSWLLGVIRMQLSKGL